MDIKTIVHLVANGDIDPAKAIELIAHECDIEIIQLTSLFNVTSVKKSSRFTQDEIDQVVDLWRKSNTKGQIALKLGRDRHSITNLISRLRRQGIDLPLRPLDHLNHQYVQGKLF
jgi:hypothetical protein